MVTFLSILILKKKVKQCCPLSTCLCLVCIEFLASYIKNNENIKGIKIKEVEIKQTRFADDSTFLNDGSEESFENLVKPIENLSNVSGLNRNTSKSKILRVGSLNKTNVRYCKDKDFK